MKGIKHSLLLLLLAFAIVSCTPQIKKDAARIKVAEDELYDVDEGFVDRGKALALVDMYESYADTYPDDSLSVEYLFNGAEICLNLGEGQRSIDLYDRVILEYPDFAKVPESLFLKGYVYENYLGDLEQARIIYSLFLEKYPDNEFADDAAISIQNLGKSPEELIKQFEEMEGSQEE